jgi:hypothetical protein
MSNTKYTYSISTDFPNQVVNATRLKNEVVASAIVTAIDYINTSGDDCDLWFKAALSEGDETILDGLVAVHSGAELPTEIQSVEVTNTNLNVSGHIEPVLPAGRRLNRYSHNFCKKETWYQDSAPVTNETLTDSGDHTIYTPATSRYWVDVTHGKLFGCRELRSTYQPVIKVDGTTKTENLPDQTNGDYSINYATGTVTFNSARSAQAVVTASYSYVRSSLFKAPAPSGYIYRVGEVKVTMAKDIALKDTILFQLWGNIGEGMQPLSGEEVYQTLDDYLQDASTIDVEFPVPMGTPGIDAWRMTTSPRLSMRFSYLWSAVIDLDSTYDMEIRCWLENDTPHVGELGVATFFGRKDEE